MLTLRKFLLIIFIVLTLGGCSLPRPEAIPMSHLRGSYYYSTNVKKLIARAMIISRQRLNYRFGSNSPRYGGMDCSGVIQYLLWVTAHIHSPRDARDIYLWVEREGVMHHVYHAYYHSSPQLRYLRPGDLLFWTGTYHTYRRPPITHVMLYIGKDKHGHPLMFGATEGTYYGRIVRGVGVFDFTLPAPDERAKFVGYGCIPHYTCKDAQQAPIQTSTAKHT